MNFAMVATSGLIGLMAGWLTARIMKDGGYGLKEDMILGLVGSITGGWIVQTVGVAPDAGMAGLVVVAFGGAALAIVGQRKIWPALT